MADLIDPRPLIRDLTAMKTEFDAITLDGIIQALKKSPTVDAVPVVRCKECIHRFGVPGQPNIQCAQMHDDDFCSYGERRNDDATD